MCGNEWWGTGLIDYVMFFIHAQDDRSILWHLVSRATVEYNTGTFPTAFCLFALDYVLVFLLCCTIGKVSCDSSRKKLEI